MKADDFIFFETPDCETAASLLLGGDLHGLDKADPIRAHAESCVHCQRRTQEIRLLSGYLSPAASLHAQPVRADRPERSGTAVVSPDRRRGSRVGALAFRGGMFALVLVACGWGVMTLRNQGSIGSLAFVEGEVYCNREGAGNEERLDSGDPIFLGDAIRTGAQGHAAITLEGINQLVLGDGTEVKFEGGRRLHHRSGHLWADIEKGHGEFEVETRGADVAVVGTQFAIIYTDTTVRVGVTEGAVRVITKGGSIQLSPGEQAEYRYDLPFLPISQDSTSDSVLFPDWVESALKGGKP